MKNLTGAREFYNNYLERVIPTMIIEHKDSIYYTYGDDLLEHFYDGYFHTGIKIMLNENVTPIELEWYLQNKAYHFECSREDLYDGFFSTELSARIAMALILKRYEVMDVNLH